MSTATVEEFALRDPLGFIELGVSLGGATREKALALLKTGIDYVEAKIGKSLHELALESLDGRCKPDGNYFRSLPYGFAKLRDGVWLPFTRDYRPLGYWPPGCTLWGCNTAGCPIRDPHRHYRAGKSRPPCIPEERKGLYDDGMPSRKGYFGRLGRVLSAATPESRAIVYRQCAPILERLRSKGRRPVSKRATGLGSRSQWRLPAQDRPPAKAPPTSAPASG
jgi:hypothetical protein